MLRTYAYSPSTVCRQKSGRSDAAGGRCAGNAANKFEHRGARSVCSRVLRAAREMARKQDQPWLYVHRERVYCG